MNRLVHALSAIGAAVIVISFVIVALAGCGSADQANVIEKPHPPSTPAGAR